MSRKEFIRLEYDFYEVILGMEIHGDLYSLLIQALLRAFHAKYGQFLTQYEFINDTELEPVIELDGPTVVVTLLGPEGE